MFEAILKDFAWASMLLLIGLFLRSKVKVFQKLFIPVAVIAGLVGLLLGSEVLGKFCPAYIHWSDNVRVGAALVCRSSVHFMMSCTIASQRPFPGRQW